MILPFIVNYKLKLFTPTWKKVGGVFLYLG